MLQMHEKAFGGPGPLGQVTALPRTPYSWIYGKALTRFGGKGKVGRWEEGKRKDENNNR